eukprot:3481967-Rhodomonas_salina.4
MQSLSISYPGSSTMRLPATSLQARLHRRRSTPPGQCSSTFSPCVEPPSHTAAARLSHRAAQPRVQPCRKQRATGASACAQCSDPESH